MNHSYFKDRISAYHDQELSLYDHQIVVEHLETCQECQKLLEEYAALEKFVSDKVDLEKKSDYWEKTAQKIESELKFTDKKEIVEEKTTQMSGLWWKASAVAASLALLTFLGLHENEITDYVEPPTKIEAEAESAKQIQTVEDKKSDISSGLIKETAKKQEEAVVSLENEIVVPAEPAQEKNLETEIIAETKIETASRARGDLVVKTPPPIGQAITQRADDIGITDGLMSDSDIAPNEIFFTEETYAKLQNKFYGEMLLEVSTESDGAEIVELKASKNKAVMESLAFTPDWERKTVDSYFKFGVDANKENDRDSAIGFFEKYISNNNSIYKDKSRIYLDSLKKLNIAE